MFFSIVHSKSKTFLAFCFCFLLATAAGTVVNKKISEDFLLWFLFPILFFLTLVSKKQVPRFITLCLLFIWLGIFRVNAALPDVQSSSDITFYNGQKHTFSGYVTKEPDVRTDGVRYVIEAQKKENQEVHGRIYVKTDLYPRYEYGDLLSIRCLFQSPEPIEDFRYDMYLAKSGIFSVCTKPFIEKIGTGEGSFLFAQILIFKNSIAKKVSLLWHEPYASFVAGVLYGYQGGLGTLQQDFNRTGITHIVAISGYNISLIATIFSSILIYLCIPRKKAFYIAVIGIALFVIFVGASASVLRAGAMGILALMGKQAGRSTKIFNVIILAITLLAFQNPYVLLWDAGFQLSVLSTAGLIYLSPLLEPKFKYLPEFLGIRENLSSTLSAIIITFPLILYEFGRFSTVAPVVNLLVLPFVPWVMTLGAGAVTLSFFYVPCAKLVSYLTFFILKYIVTVVHWFSAWPLAAVDIRIPLWTMAVFYLALIIFLCKKDSLSSSPSSVPSSS